jgi:iron complex outermembrane receptor protein
VLTTTNVATAVTKGVELELVMAPTREFKLRTSLGYVDARFTDYKVRNTTTGLIDDLSATPFTYAPKWTVSFAPEYKATFDRSVLGLDSATLQARVVLQSDIVVAGSTINPLSTQDGYATTDASFTLAGSQTGISLTFYAKNIFNKHYITTENLISGLVDVVSDGLDRTFGGVLTVKF